MHLVPVEHRPNFRIRCGQSDPKRGNARLAQDLDSPHA